MSLKRNNAIKVAAEKEGVAFRRAKAIVGLALGDAPTDAEVERAQNVLERRRLMEEVAR
jgi:hypothetical protein